MTKINEQEFEKWKQENQANLIVWAEQFKAAVSAGENALRSVILINGGAAVALLAFVSNVWDKSITNQSMNFNVLLISMAIFTIGTLFGGLAMSWHYLEHNASIASERRKWGKCCDWFVGISYVFFVIASLIAIFAFWMQCTGKTTC